MPHPFQRLLHPRQRRQIRFNKFSFRLRMHPLTRRIKEPQNLLMQQMRMRLAESLPIRRRHPTPISPHRRIDQPNKRHRRRLVITTRLRLWHTVLRVVRLDPRPNSIQSIGKGISTQIPKCDPNMGLMRPQFECQSANRRTSSASVIANPSSPVLTVYANIFSRTQESWGVAASAIITLPLTARFCKLWSAFLEGRIALWEETFAWV
jgi:hypothetical protein